MLKMKYLSLLLLLIFVVSFSACEKDNSNNTNSNNDYFISFDLDGVPQEIRASGSSQSVSASGNGESTSTVTDPNNSNYSMSINLSVGTDSLLGADFLAMVGQKIEVGDCWNGGCTSNAEMWYSTATNSSVKSQSADNVLSNYYIKVNSASYHSTIPQHGFGPDVVLYLVEGEFELVLKQYSNSTPENATNGKFRLLFSENVY